jgi:hypothetical protein
MMKIIRNGRAAFLVGPTSMFEQLPLFMKVTGVWPRLVFHFSDLRDQISNRDTRRGSNYFQVSLPAVTLGLPPEIPNGDDCTWTQLGSHQFAFRFGPEELPASGEQIETQATELLLDFKALCDRYEALCGASLTDTLGVALTWLDDEAGEGDDLDEEEQDAFSVDELNVEESQEYFSFDEGDCVLGSPKSRQSGFQTNLLGATALVCSSSPTAVSIAVPMEVKQAQWATVSSLPSHLLVKAWTTMTGECRPPCLPSKPRERVALPRKRRHK